MAAAAPSSAHRRAAALLCTCEGGSGVVGALALAAPRPLGGASAAPEQYGRDGSASAERPLSTATGVRAAARHAGGGNGHGLSGTVSSPQLSAAGAVGRGLSRSVVIAHRSRAQCGEGVLVRVAHLD